MIENFLLNTHSRWLSNLLPEGVGFFIIVWAFVAAAWIIKLRRNIKDLKEINEVLVNKSRNTHEIKENNKELEQFTYAVSHDMQEPLRIVSSYAQLWVLKYKGKTDETGDKYLSYIVNNVQRIQSMIIDLLTYSRIGHQDPHVEKVDANQACDEAIFNLRMAIKEKNALVLRDDLPVILINRRELVQLFQNLIGNAIKYCIGKAQVRISVHIEGESWVFSVKDNGIGIEAQYFERIFEVFQRLHTREEFSGTGLGLSICKKIVERNKEHIWVESQPGQGSIFYFTVAKSKVGAYEYASHYR